jgi:hypothetical protein
VREKASVGQEQAASGGSGRLGVERYNMAPSELFGGGGDEEAYQQKLFLHG